mgnify:CR=1 FL=1
MTTVQSSQSGSAYSNALAKLLERMQSTNDSQSGSTSSTTTTSTTTLSLASVLNSEDSSSSSSTQTSSAITALMMDIQQLKSAASSSTSSSDTGTTDGSGQPPSLADMFSKTDTDGDGKLSLAEFVSNRPDGMSEDDATSMFKSIDSNDTGSITEDQLSSFMEKNAPAQGPGPGGGPQDASDIFSKIDSDSDGSVSLDEFVSGRPKGMSEEDATTLFNSIDTEGTGSISEEQFAEKLKEQSQTSGAASTDGSSSSSDVAALAKDIMKQLMQVIQSFNNGYVDSSAYAASTTASDTSTVS